jgi:hypothetical protein
MKRNITTKRNKKAPGDKRLRLTPDDRSSSRRVALSLNLYAGQAFLEP